MSSISGTAPQQQHRPPSVSQSTAGGNGATTMATARQAPGEEQTMTCVSVVEDGSQLAFAAYDEGSNKIILEQVHANELDTESVIEQFYMVTRPTMILVSQKLAMNALLLESLTKPYQYNNDDNNEGDQQNAAVPNSIPYRQVKSSAYDYKRAQALILQSLRVQELIKRSQQAPQRGTSLNNNIGDSQMLFEPSSYHSIASVVDFDSSVQIRALGSLLSFLQSTLFRLEEGGTVTVASIEQANSSMFMRISSNTLQALHIFSVEHHPLMGARGQSHSKEGFSLFSLLGARTKSPMGKQCMKDWMLKPLVDIEAITMRQDAIELFLRQEFSRSIGNLFRAMEQVGGIDRMVQRMMKCTAAPLDFVVFCRSLAAASDVCRILEQDFVHGLRGQLGTLQQSQGGEDDTQEQQEILKRYLAFVYRILHTCSVQVLEQLQERVSSAIDINLTIEEKSISIKYGYHEELDATKELYENLEELFCRVARQLVDNHKMEGVKVFFMTQIGFLIEIDRRPHFQEPTTYPDLPPDFTLVFNEGDKSYFKDDEMRTLDQEYGDPVSFISDTEQMIVKDIEDDILDCESELRTTFGTLAELDCLLALAECANDLDFVRPRLQDPSKKCIKIQNGRHPIQELVTETEFVPNSTSMDARCRVNVITGPNFSGKSCYTRQVGLLVYMAHIGSFLPCERATISITDQILTRISVVDTCLVPQSSFQLDMTQMGMILRRCTPSTLVLVDEFGKGTSPSSGIAVLTAALKRLSAIKCKVVCTTHFLEIFSLDLVHDGIEGIKASRMTVHWPSEDEPNQAVPLFKLEDGVANSSAGLSCAQTAGVHRDVIGRAHEIISALKNGDKVEPSMDVIRPKLDNLSVDAKEALTLFLRHPNWKSASDSDVRRLLHHINRM